MDHVTDQVSSQSHLRLRVVKEILSSVSMTLRFRINRGNVPNGSIRITERWSPLLFTLIKSLTRQFLYWREITKEGGGGRVRLFYLSQFKGKEEDPTQKSTITGTSIRLMDSDLFSRETFDNNPHNSYSNTKPFRSRTRPVTNSPCYQILPTPPLPVFPLRKHLHPPRIPLPVSPFNRK